MQLHDVTQVLHEDECGENLVRSLRKSGGATGDRRFGGDAAGPHRGVEVLADGNTGRIVASQETQAVALDPDLTVADRADLAGHDVVVTHESARKEVGRVPVDILRTSYLLDPPVLHDHDLIGDGQRLLLIVGDVDEGDPQAALQRA